MATFYASKTGEVSAREKEHSALVRELAGERVLSAAEGNKYGTSKKRMQGGALSDRRQTLLCRRLPQPFGRLRDT